MSNDSQNSQDEMTQRLKTEVEKQKEELNKHKVVFPNLIIAAVGAEQFIGEIHHFLDSSMHAANERGETEQLVGTPIEIRNPKRFIRLQQMRPDGNVSVATFVADLDAIDGGIIQVLPTMAYWVDKQSLVSQIEILKLLNKYFQSKMASSIGLTLPDTKLKRG